MFLLLYPLISNECFMEASINAWLAIVVEWIFIIMYTILLRRMQLGPTINLTPRTLFCNAYLFFTSCMLILPWYFLKPWKTVQAATISWINILIAAYVIYIGSVLPLVSDIFDMATLGFSWWKCDTTSSNIFIFLIYMTRCYFSSSQCPIGVSVTCAATVVVGCAKWCSTANDCKYVRRV